MILHLVDAESKLEHEPVEDYQERRLRLPTVFVECKFRFIVSGDTNQAIKYQDIILQCIAEAVQQITVEPKNDQFKRS